MRSHPGPVRVVWLLLPLASLLTGCGGSDTPTAAPPSGGTGSLSVTVRFPARPSGVGTAAIPLATNSFRIRIDDIKSSELLAPEKVISRGQYPTETVQFDGIRAGHVRVTVRAYWSTDGAGDPIAELEQSAEVAQGQTATIHMVLGLLPARVSLTPNETSLEKWTTSTLVATVYDADDNILANEPLEWSCDDELVAKISETGEIFANDFGATAINVRTRNGLGVTAYVNVWGRTVVSALVHPPSAHLDGIGSIGGFWADALDGQGEVIPYATCTWSSDPGVVALAPYGTAVDVTALVESGSATVSADFGNGVVGYGEVYIGGRGAPD